MPLAVGRDISVRAVEAALATEEKEIVVIAQRDSQVELPAVEDLYAIGVKAVIKRTSKGEEGIVEVTVQGRDRMVLLKLEEDEPYLVGRETDISWRSSARFWFPPRLRSSAQVTHNVMRRPSILNRTLLRHEISVSRPDKLDCSRTVATGAGSSSDRRGSRGASESEGSRSIGSRTRTGGDESVDSKKGTGGEEVRRRRGRSSFWVRELS